MKTQIKLRKANYENEFTALDKAVKELNISPSKIETAHTEKQYVFYVKFAKAQTGKKTLPESNEKTYYIPKEEENDEHHAKIMAVDYFDTFEGNIKTVENTETYFAFEKVRG